jgi:hypothetical protein
VIQLLFKFILYIDSQGLKWYRDEVGSVASNLQSVLDSGKTASLMVEIVL